MKGARILILDDEPQMLENLDRLLSSEGCSCRTMAGAAGLREALEDFRPEVVVSDLRMPGEDGLSVLETAHDFDGELPVVLITAYASVASAVTAIKKGAFDYLSKPFSADQLSVTVRRAIRYRGLVRENESLRERAGLTGPGGLVGQSPAMLEVLDQVARVAPSEASVLVIGESGTGKELLARAIHDASDRRRGPFATIDCTSLPEGLLESELYGHEKGAFTGAVARREGLIAAADRGTLFLDEIGELSLALQAKLLRVIEERQVRAVGAQSYRPVDVRMVAATNVDLADAVSAGSFRGDLYYRLNVVQIRVPPLRERRDDVPLLVERFIDGFARSSGRSRPGVSPGAMQLLQGHAWPGNVRELRNTIERAVILDRDGEIGVDDMPPEIVGEPPVPGPDGAPLGRTPYAEARERALRAFRTQYLDALLREHGGNVSGAARTAGVSRRSLHRWISEGSEPQAEGGEP